MAVSRKLTGLACLCVILCGIEALPDGAPTKACSTLTPPHGTAQTGSSPYMIEANATTYKTGQAVAVTISGGNFQGVLLQARKKGSSDAIGVFTDPGPSSNLKLLSCSGAGSAVTHANTNPKNQSVVIWNPPTTGQGDIEFIATVAQAKTTWWTGQKSDTLKAESSGPASMGSPMKAHFGVTALAATISVITFGRA